MSGAAPQPESATSERRGSWGRALESLRRALLRRRGAGRKDSSATGTEKALKSASASTQPEIAIPPPPSSTVIIASLPTADRISLEPDSSPDDDLDEPLLPNIPRRIGMDADKAEALFARHGLDYSPRRHRSNNDDKPAPKMRRVEKPIRVRLHYRCHECQGHFAKDRLCAKCGHRRCAECTRQPGKGVRELMESGRLMADEEMQGNPSAAIVDWATQVPREAPKPNEIAATSSHALEKDDAAEGDLDPDETSDTLFLPATRPRTGPDLLARPQIQVHRRACHVCAAPFSPPTSTECTTCAHMRCSLCPRWEPPKSPDVHDRRPGAITAPRSEQVKEEKPAVVMVAAVQRVYRKPRMRVRWTCDQCQTVFVDRDGVCQGCGHEKCSGCSRNPRQRIPVRDPAVLQAVAERLTEFRGMEEMRAMAAVAG